MEGKTAIVLGVWNKWSIAYAISQAYVREGAKLVLTYQNERAKPAVEELGRELGAVDFFPCDVQAHGDIEKLAEAVAAAGALAMGFCAMVNLAILRCISCCWTKLASPGKSTRPSTIAPVPNVFTCCLLMAMPINRFP